MNELTAVLEQTHVGDPQVTEWMTVFPLFGPDQGLDYVLLDDALQREQVTITEKGETGSVPELLVVNDSDQRVLIIEADELVGAMQNRIVNTTVLLPGRSKTVIPVSCSEAGRWREMSRAFASTGSHASRRLRTTLHCSVSKSLDAGRGHRSDQRAVWDRIGDSLHLHRVASPTSAMHDVWTKRRSDLDSLLRELKPVEGQIGVALVRDGEVSIDLFNRHGTLASLYRKLLSAFALDALVRRESKARPVERHSVEGLLRQVAELPLRRFRSVGLGDDLRFTSGDISGGALVVEGTVVHLAVHAA